MKFELLPNEILIDCFEYLEVFHIFHSFDQLNHRLNQLIRAIRLYLNYRHAQKPLFDRFCVKMLSEPEIKSQIYSLQISNEDSCDQIQRFLSWFSLNEFPYLQGLSLTKVGGQHVIKLESMLPLLTNLTDFRLMISYCDIQKLLSLVPLSKLRRIAVQTLPNNIILLYEPCKLTHLIVYHCHLYDIMKMFKNLPLLKYLNLQCDNRDHNEDQIYSLETSQLVFLRQMVILGYKYSFEAFEFIVSQTRNLQYLTMMVGQNVQMVDAPCWERLITLWLPKLTAFNFEFYCYGKCHIVNKFQEFQSDFWLKEHQWYSDYGLCNDFAVFHTVPLIRGHYTLLTDLIEYQLKKSSKLDNDKELKLDFENTRSPCQYYFPSIISLTVHCSYKNDNILSEEEVFQSLLSVVNLSNLQHLSVEGFPSEDTAVILLKILKISPRLSSLSLDGSNLGFLFKNHQLKKYLNEKIRTLSCKYSPRLDTSDEVRQFCELFRNIEHLKYSFDEREHVLYVLNHLPHLLTLEIAL